MNNEPAFPVPAQYFGTGSDNESPGYDGMTLRDYFAAKAIQGFIVSPEWCQNFDSRDTKAIRAVADLSYVVADAMLAARRTGQ